MAPTLEIFTIVLNGMPFIKEHLPIFSRLKAPWRWHIVEGVALPEKCTGWCQPALPADHNNWRSNDGTSEYLDSVASKNVLIYRAPGPWHGKLDMCNAPLVNISKGAVLHEIDVDEFWTPEQLETIYWLFTSQGAGRGWYYCDYYLGPDIHVTNRARPGNATDHAWIRTHRYAGQPWQAHEPPAIPFEGREAKHDETYGHFLEFKHFAYATEAQVRFKENYYRYANAVAQWRALQANTQWPVNPGYFLHWVHPQFGAIADKTDHFEKAISQIQNT